MKLTWRIIAVALLLMMSSTQCSKMDQPEAAAKVSFSEWAVNIRMPYRHENFETIDNDGVVATVLLTVEVKLEGEWETKQAEIPCEKVDNEWQCDRSIQFR